jgi:WD40 repeat protein
LPEGAIARCGTIRFRHWGHIHCVAFSADGKTLASGGWDRTVRVWDIKTGRQLQQFVGNPDSPIDAIALSPDGKKFAAGNGDGGLRLWDRATGKLLHRLVGHKREIKTLIFSADGKVLASMDEATARLWDVASGKELRLLADFAGRQLVCVGAFSADLRFLAVGWSDEAVELWDARKGRILHQYKAHKGWVGAVAFSPDGGLLASAGRDMTSPQGDRKRPKGQVQENCVRLWDTIKGNEVRRIGPHTTAIQSVAFSPDGKSLLSCGSDGVGRLWDTASGKSLRCYGKSPGRSCRMTFSPDGKTIVSWGDCLRLWNVATGRERLEFASHSNEVGTVAFAPGRGTLVSGSQDYTIRFWEPTTGKEARSPLRQSDNVLNIAFTEDGKKLFTGSSDHTIRLWDLGRGRVIRQWQGSDESCVNTLALSRDGKILASGSWDGRMTRWEAASGRRLSISEKMRGFVHCVAFSPDGKMLASGGATVVLWSPATGKRIREVPQPQTEYRIECRSLAFSPDSRRLAVAGELAGCCWIVDISTYKVLHTLGGDRHAAATAVAYSCDGKMLACGWRDGIIDLYETATGLRRQQFRGHKGDVESLAFSPCGRYLASGADDATVLVWDLFARSATRPRAKAVLTTDQVKVFFEKDLASLKHSSVHGVMCDLVKEPARAVEGFKKCLRPVQRTDPEQIDRLVANLDNDRFSVREEASRELRRLDKVVEPALRGVLAGKPSAELARRVKRLLQDLEDWPASSADSIRMWRALEILEQIGTKDAQNVLKLLADGAPEARLTQEAKASLERLAKRPAPR